MDAPEKLTTRIKLPSSAGKLEEFRLSAPRDFGTAGRKAFNRIALAAAHVVADPLARGNPWLDAAVDWDATLAYRRYLWSLGLGVAEAMDTAQRGMGLEWNNSLELIRRYAPPLAPDEAARRSPNLEDVFLALVGRDLGGRSEAPQDEEAAWLASVT